MRPHVKPSEGSISVDKASAILGMTPEALTALCDQDPGQKYHHRTIYTNRIRFFEPDLKRIKKRVGESSICGGWICFFPTEKQFLTWKFHFPWQFLNFFPLPQWQGSFRPGILSATIGVWLFIPDTKSIFCIEGTLNVITVFPWKFVMTKSPREITSIPIKNLEEGGLQESQPAFWE